MSELKRCPFCGGEAKLVKTHDGMYGIFHESEECPIDAENFVCDWQYDTAEEAIEAWNTRKPMDRIVERLEALKNYESYGDCPRDGMCDKKLMNVQVVIHALQSKS